jgi:hypothetical protein
VNDADGFPYGDLSSYTDLGDSHWYTTLGCDCEGVSGPHGILQPHRKQDGAWCGGAVTFAGHDPGLWTVDGVLKPRPTWQVISLDPLHLEPSLLCDPQRGGCGDHGFIRNGRWESA